MDCSVIQKYELLNAWSCRCHESGGSSPEIRMISWFHQLDHRVIFFIFSIRRFCPVVVVPPTNPCLLKIFLNFLQVLFRISDFKQHYRPMGQNSRGKGRSKIELRREFVLFRRRLWETEKRTQQKENDEKRLHDLVWRKNELARVILHPTKVAKTSHAFAIFICIETIRSSFL